MARQIPDHRLMEFMDRLGIPIEARTRELIAAFRALIMEIQLGTVETW